MEIQLLPDAAAVAAQAARWIARECLAAVAARGRFIMAVSGGRTPWEMLRALAREPLPWDRLYIAQVDERVAPAGHPDRNLTQLRTAFLAPAPIPPNHVLAMPVESSDLEAAAADYAHQLQLTAGTPPILDLVQLGMGPDGHTASLVPGDPVLGINGADVATTGIYQGRRRMTLTYPIINRARRVLWVITGAEKAPMLCRLRNGDEAIPAGGVARDQALVLADCAAARPISGA